MRRKTARPLVNSLGIMKTILLAFLPAVVLAASPDLSPQTFIAAIYMNHQPWTDHIIAFDKKQELAKYFDSELTELFLKEEECKNRTHELCNMNSDPIYCQQDFAESLKDLSVIPMPGQPNKYAVSFFNIVKHTVVFSINKVSVGWRVSDIQCEEGLSLKQQLSRPPV